MRDREIRQSFFVTIGQDNAVSHASAGASAYVGLPPTREPQGTSSSLSSPPKHRKSRIKCGGGERYSKAFSLPSDRITPFPAKRETLGVFLRAANSPQAREPQGTSSSLSSSPKHRKSRIKCGGGERYSKAFSLPSDRITPFPASGSPSAYFFGLQTALRHANHKEPLHLCPLRQNIENPA